jgi:E3 ubiquitin-protein ligase MYCBP2
MNYQSNTEAVKFGSWTFEDVLSKLLNIVTEPVEHSLKTGVVSDTSHDLVNKSCRLISTVISELSNTKNNQETGLAQLTNRLSLQTPNRFAKINSSHTWNSGNGSPDAICFNVDKQGIMIAGAMIFGGVGNYDYELELLHNPPSKDREKDGGQGWTPLEVSHGSCSADECSNDLFAVR